MYYWVWDGFGLGNELYEFLSLLKSLKLYTAVSLRHEATVNLLIAQNGTFRPSA